MPQGNQQMMDSAPDESPFQQVIPSIPQQSLYPSLAALGTSVNMAISPPIPFSRRVINDIEEQQRKAPEDTVEGTIRLTNTLPTSEVEEQEEEVIIPRVNPQAGTTEADTQKGNSATGVFRNRRDQMVPLQKMMVMTTYPMTKILQCKIIRHQKHPKMTIIILPLVMMILMTQCSLVAQ